MERALSDPKMLMGGSMVIVLGGLTVWGVLSSPTKERKETADEQLLLKPGDKVAWEKTTGAEGLATGESNIGVRRLQVKNEGLKPANSSGTQASLAAPSAKPVSRAGFDALHKTVDAAAGQDVDSTALVENTGRGPGEEAQAGGIGRIDALDNTNWAAGGEGGPIQGGAPQAGTGVAGANAPAGKPTVQAGGRTIQTSAGRTASRETAGTMAVKGGSSGGGRGQLAARPSTGRPAAASAAAGGGSVGNASFGGGSSGPGGASGSMPESGSGKLAGASGMMNVGGAGGGGGIAGGAGGGPEADPAPEKKTRAEVDQEVAALKSLAGSYYGNVVFRTSRLEMERLPSLKTKVDSAYGILNSLKNTLATAKRNYSGEALQAVQDTSELVVGEQLPRLASASQGIEQSVDVMGNLLNDCQVMYYAKELRTNYTPYYNYYDYYGYQGYYGYDWYGQGQVVLKDGQWMWATTEEISRRVDMPPRDALAAQDRADQALTNAQHVRELSETFTPIVAEEYERIAKVIAKTDKNKAASFRSLSSDIRGAFASVVNALPSGLMVGATMGVADLQKAGLEGYRSIRAEDKKIKEENLTYVQCQELNNTRDKMTSAMGHSGDASGNLGAASNSMVALVKAGKNASEAYIEVCEAKNLMAAVAAKTP
ncbi:MAG: hypothetical protein WC728_14825 [Elusimicrobiota bacterium]